MNKNVRLSIRASEEGEEYYELKFKEKGKAWVALWVRLEQK